MSGRGHTGDGHPRHAQMAYVPVLSAGYQTLPTRPAKLSPLIVAPGPTHIVICDVHGGARSLGRLHAHSAAALDALELGLDYYDAANEDAQGRLPHETPAGRRRVEREKAAVVPIRAKRAYRKRGPRWENNWTREKIVAAMQAWNAQHGSPPTALQWRGAGEGWPSRDTVEHHFGKWNMAIEAAGFTVLTPGRQRRRERVAA